MNKFTRISFTIFKVSSFGFVLLYLAAVIIVGSAGHSTGDSMSFFAVAAYSVSLFLLIHHYQKILRKGTRIGIKMKTLFLLMVTPAIIISVVVITTLLNENIEKELIIVCTILAIFTVSGLAILKQVLFAKIHTAEPK